MDRIVYVSQARTANNAYGAAMIAAAARRAADRDAARKRAEADLTREVGRATWLDIKADTPAGKLRIEAGRETAIRLLMDPEVGWVEVWVA